MAIRCASWDKGYQGNERLFPMEAIGGAMSRQIKKAGKSIAASG